MTLRPVHLSLIMIGLLAAWGLARMAPDEERKAQSGLEVYLGEGCIHCHSQYRRPVGVDSELWGPPSDPELEASRQRPVLFGNRRQGPDLSNAGLRRSRQWNKAHLLHPHEVRNGSRMPSYAHLFTEGDPRGEALLDYLESLGQEDRAAWLRHVADWQPATPLETGSARSGQGLFREYCAGCHGDDGRGSGPLASSFQPAPRNLTRPDGWIWITQELDPGTRDVELARLIKFGRPGTSMAGTEWLGDDQLADLVRFLDQLEQ